MINKRHKKYNKKKAVSLAILAAAMIGCQSLPAVNIGSQVVYADEVTQTTEGSSSNAGQDTSAAVTDGEAQTDPSGTDTSQTDGTEAADERTLKLSQCTVAVLPDPLNYDGLQHDYTVMVIDNGVVLEEGKDYTYSYYQAYKMTVPDYVQRDVLIIQGKNEYAGQHIQKNYDIQIKEINVGDLLVVSKANYQVTSDDTVTYLSPVTKDASLITVPAYITVGSHKYNVTAIADKAFANDTAVIEMEIGKNVASIGRNAFYNCSHLMNLEFKTKLLNEKNTGTNIFLKCGCSDYEGLSIKVPKGMKKVYLKMFLKRKLSKKAYVSA